MLFLTLELLDSGARPPATTIRSPSRSMRKHAWRGRVTPKATPLRHGTPGAPANQAADAAAWKRPATAPGSPWARPVDTAEPRLQSSGLTPASHRPLRGGGREHAVRTRARTHVSLPCSSTANTAAACTGPARVEGREPRLAVEGSLTVPALCREPGVPSSHPGSRSAQPATWATPGRVTSGREAAGSVSGATALRKQRCRITHRPGSSRRHRCAELRGPERTDNGGCEGTLGTRPGYNRGSQSRQGRGTRAAQVRALTLHEAVSRRLVPSRAVSRRLALFHAVSRDPRLRPTRSKSAAAP